MYSITQTCNNLLHFAFAVSKLSSSDQLTYSKKGDEDIGYSSGFIVALLAKSMIPELRMPGTRII
jgi:hypothetical protein